MKYITVKLTHDQAKELQVHLRAATDFEIDRSQEAFLLRILNKIAKELAKS